MISARRSGAVVLAVLTLALVGCEDGGPLEPTDTGPTGPVTVTFTGTIAQGGVMVHDFTVEQAGNTEIIVLSVGPRASTMLGIGVGTPDGDDCALQTTSSTAQQGDTLITATEAGDFCVSVFDAGDVSPSEPTTYAVEVTHP